MRLPLAFALATLALVSPAAAQEACPRTWANPVDVDYKYNFEQTHQGVSCRTGADPWDPDMFIHDNGEWYFYWGLSNLYPLNGARIDPTPPTAFIGAPVPLHVLHPDQHGWERFGQGHSGSFPGGAARSRSGPSMSASTAISP